MSLIRFLALSTLLGLGLPGCIFVDGDGDGFSVGEGDCDDRDPQAFPGGVEVGLDGIDHDCDGRDGVRCFQDWDQDGFGGANVSFEARCDHSWQVEATGDCDDRNPKVSPAAVDDPATPNREDCAGFAFCYQAEDGDGWGSEATDDGVDPTSCGPGRVPVGGDCDDADPIRHPGAVEVQDDGIDQNCSGFDLTICFEDHDGDGWGDDEEPDDDGCRRADRVNRSGDCEDRDPTVHPGMIDIAYDGKDQNCSGDDAILCLDPADDGDGDGWPGPGAGVVSVDGDSCEDEGYASPKNPDCDDNHLGINPGQDEVPGDGVDQNCNGVDAIACYEDADLDGHGDEREAEQIFAIENATCEEAGLAPVADDCDDHDDDRFPGNPEVPDDHVDQDCDDETPR
jgi:hypothetical protein